MTGTTSGVGPEGLHDDHDLPVLALADRVPDSQVVRRQMEAVGARQRVVLRKRIGERRNRLLQEVKDRLMRASGCGSASSSSQVLSGKRRTRSLTGCPRPPLVPRE